MICVGGLAWQDNRFVIGRSRVRISANASPDTENLKISIIGDAPCPVSSFWTGSSNLGRAAHVCEQVPGSSPGQKKIKGLASYVAWAAADILEGAVAVLTRFLNLSVFDVKWGVK